MVPPLSLHIHLNFCVCRQHFAVRNRMDGYIVSYLLFVCNFFSAMIPCLFPSLLLELYAIILHTLSLSFSLLSPAHTLLCHLKFTQCAAIVWISFILSLSNTNTTQNTHSYTHHSNNVLNVSYVFVTKQWLEKISWRDKWMWLHNYVKKHEQNKTKTE